MATEEADATAAGRDESHVRSLLVLAVTSLGGILAGVGAWWLAADWSDRLGVALLGGALLVEFGLLEALDVDVTDFGTKDVLYVVFMTFSMWYITWAVLLSTAA